MKVIPKKSAVAKKTKSDSKDQFNCKFCGKTYGFLDFINHSQCYKFTCTSCSAGFDFEHHLNQHSMEKHGDVSFKSNSFVACNKNSKTSSVQNQNTRDYNLRFKPVSVYGDTNRDLAGSKNQHFEETELNTSADKSTKKKLFSESNLQKRFSKSNSQKRLKIDNSLEQNHNEVSNISDENQFSNGIKASIRNQTLEIKKKETGNTLKNKSISDLSCSRSTFEELPCNSKRKKNINTRKNTIPDDFCSKTTNEELGCSSPKKKIRNTLKNSIPVGFCSKTINMELECSSTKTETKYFRKYSIPDNKESGCSLIKKRTRNTLKNSVPGTFSSNTTVKELPCSSMQRETRNTLKNSVPGVFDSTNTVEELPCNSRQRETRNTLKISIADDFCSKTTVKELPHNSTKEIKNLNKNSNQEGFNLKTSNKESCYSTKSSTSDQTILNGLCKNNLIKRNRKCKIFSKQSISKPQNPYVPISKKDIKNSKLRAPVEKIKKANTQEGQRYSIKLNENHSLKKAKHDDLPPGNPLTDKVDLRLLLNSIQDEDTGILLQKQNNVDANVKCSKCGKPFRTIKQASIHFSSCKSPKCKITSVPVNEVRWVCILCHKDYSHNIQLVQHKKFCKILMKTDYGNAYETCPKCKYNFISLISLLQHKCEENVQALNSCTVQLRKLPSFTGPLCNRMELYECRYCGKCYFMKCFCVEHLKNTHNITDLDVDVKPLYINLDKHFITTIIKSEDGMKDTESEDGMNDTESEDRMNDTESEDRMNDTESEDRVNDTESEDGMKDTESEKDSSTSQTSNVQESSSSDVNDNLTTNLLDYINHALNSASFSMPQLFRNSPNQPSTNPNSAQVFNLFDSLNTLLVTAKPPTNMILSYLCENFCKCPKVKTSSEGEKKICVKCMETITDISRLSSFLLITSFNVHKIKRENNDPGTSGENFSDWTSLSITSAKNTSKNLNLCRGDATHFLTLQLFDAMNLTPPSSFHGFTLPTTPDTLLVQSPPMEATLPCEELCSSSNAAGCYSGNVVPDITQLRDGQQSPSALSTSLDEPNGLEAISGEASSTEDASPDIASSPEDASPVIASSTEDASPVIASSTEDASPVIASSTEDASPVIASSTEDASPVSSTEDASPVIASSPEEFLSSQEQSETPLPPYNIICERNKLNKVDVWAIVASPDTEEVASYLCGCCLEHSFEDQDSLARHLFTNHGKQGDILGSYASKPKRS